MPYGIPDALWKQLSQADRDEVIKEADAQGLIARPSSPPPPPPPPTAPYPVYIPGTSSTYGVTEGGKQYEHDVTEFAYRHGETHSPPPLPAPPPRETQASEPPKVVWAYVRQLSSFPGNHPNFADDRAHGIGGYMLKADDPLLRQGAADCINAGFLVGIWDAPAAGESAADFSNRLVQKAHENGASMVAPDMEFIAKGYAGSPGWQYNEDAAEALRAADPTIPVAVTPLPLQDDFNYAAWVNIGSDVWVQTYGETLNVTFDPLATRDRVIANGVPPDRVTVILPAGTLASSIPEVQGAGLPNWAIYTIDDVGAGDRSVPFGDNSGSQGGSPRPPDDSPYPYVPPPPPSDSGISIEDLDLGEGEPPDDFEENWEDEYSTPDQITSLSDFLRLTDTPENRTLAASVPQHTPNHGGIHDTLGLPGFPAIDFFAKPGTKILAPVDATAYKFSGHDPRTGWHDAPGQAFGWSMYLRATGYGGSEFYITHIGARLVHNGAKVVRGQVIGTVGNMPSGRQSHIHVGVHGGAISAAELPSFYWFGSGAGTTPLPSGPGPVISTQAPNTEHIGDEYKRIANFVNSGGEKRRQDLLMLRNEARKAVR